MKTFATAFVATAACLAGPALAQGKQDFTLVNRTGYTLESVFVSPSSANSWGEDIMGRDVLDDGEDVDISFSRGDRACKWDLKVSYDDKSTAEWDGFDLCKTSKIIIYYDRKKDKTWAEYE